ncbi:uncharacterized protein LOC118562463 isoform X2 [Fundulus heteroclitus]|uniref:uncharacterized protein LOC118562463 isoform X2 n=1 Tax=Fundulus heteroclitus TaxID=8078 RepID=UPI00165AC58F|nr:uncharacterized protein LOC118562463 isoform X2 [Fundulus heteroclitus]
MEAPSREPQFPERGTQRGAAKGPTARVRNGSQAEVAVLSTLGGGAQVDLAQQTHCQLALWATILLQCKVEVTSLWACCPGKCLPLQVELTVSQQVSCPSPTTALQCWTAGFLSAPPPMELQMAN